MDREDTPPAMPRGVHRLQVKCEVAFSMVARNTRERWSTFVGPMAHSFMHRAVSRYLRKQRVRERNLFFFADPLSRI